MKSCLAFKNGCGAFKITRATVLHFESCEVKNLRFVLKYLFWGHNLRRAVAVTDVSVKCNYLKTSDTVITALKLDADFQ